MNKLYEVVPVSEVPEKDKTFKDTDVSVVVVGILANEHREEVFYNFSRKAWYYLSKRGIPHLTHWLRPYPAEQLREMLERVWDASEKKMAELQWQKETGIESESPDKKQYIDKVIDELSNQ